LSERAKVYSLGKKKNGLSRLTSKFQAIALHIETIETGSEKSTGLKERFVCDIGHQKVRATLRLSGISTQVFQGSFQPAFVGRVGRLRPGSGPRR
jgi:hypothetical protein